VIHPFYIPKQKFLIFPLTENNDGIVFWPRNLDALYTAPYDNSAFSNHTSKCVETMSSCKRSGVGRREQEASNQGDLYRSQTVAQLREKVKKLTAQQVELSEQREQVLVDRQNFVQSAARVHAQISRSANAAANLMNVFRRHYNELGTTLPAELIGAYTTLDEEKDKLGSLEADHLKTEDDLGALEWNFMELENDLYQYDLHQLLSDEELDDDSPRAQEPSHTMAKTPDPISASTAIQYQVASTEYNRLIHRFKILREKVTERLVDDASDLGIDENELQELANSGFVQTFSDMLTQMVDCEVRLKRLKGELISHRDARSVTSRRLSEPTPYTGKLSFDSDMISRVHSDGDVPDSVENVPTLHRVKEWLLDCLKQNALEKTKYLSILQQALAHIDILELDLTDWEVLATQQWSFDMIEPTEVPCIGMRRSTQETLRINDMEETQKAFNQTYDDQHHTSVANRYSGQGPNSNLLNDLVLEGPFGDHDHPRYHLSETLNITESSIDVDEKLVSRHNNISQLQQAPKYTSSQEDTRSAFPNVNTGIARTHWGIKKTFFQESGMERTDSLSPSLTYPKDTALDRLKEPRSTLENIYEPISGMISGISSPPVRHSVSRPLVERTHRYDAPSGTVLIPHEFVSGSMENNRFCDQLIHNSFPPILPYGYRL
jgi:hypothetical protein